MYSDWYLDVPPSSESLISQRNSDWIKGIPKFKAKVFAIIKLWLLFFGRVTKISKGLSKMLNQPFNLFKIRAKQTGHLFWDIHTPNNDPGNRPSLYVDPLKLHTSINENVKAVKAAKNVQLSAYFQRYEGKLRLSGSWKRAVIDKERVSSERQLGTIYWSQEKLRPLNSALIQRVSLWVYLTLVSPRFTQQGVNSTRKTR